jgi:hypothetical protein
LIRTRLFENGSDANLHCQRYQQQLKNWQWKKEASKFQISNLERRVKRANGDSIPLQQELKFWG